MAICIVPHAMVVHMQCTRPEKLQIIISPYNTRVPIKLKPLAAVVFVIAVQEVKAK
jgi:hypothetical protein